MRYALDETDQPPDGKGSAEAGRQPGEANEQPGEAVNQAGEADTEPGGAGNQAREKGTLPGLPRLFFAPDHDQRAERSFSTTEPAEAGAAGPFGQQFGRPAGAGTQHPVVGTRPGGGRPLLRPPAAPSRPARPRPTRPPDRELRNRALASLIFGVLALVALLGLSGNLSRGVYLLIFSAVIGIAACVIGTTAVVKARKTGTYRPRGAVAGIVLGAIAALLSIPILATYLAFPHQVDNYVKCLSQSQSSDGQQACMNRFYKQIHLGSAGLPTAHRTAPGLAYDRAQGNAEGPPRRAVGGSS